ncbi:MAG: bifunctional phosphoribosylaminoimidazolecarboxamide formyltransferase/IMP cyclohydrolase [Flavobacteriales bacterium]|nr:bifunctional phosphoribosylaminoimidazolecarboxamide formyltransferase/IMP cyclohydrolase [Flavobacteriales bacterium]MCB9449171.1 bifunctional phosphoribosylaminoimidazolecarboxamide formyltransferase/IMP cyclohydrolase [Flavobacteriales bacterium]
MEEKKKIKSALVSVFNKDGLEGPVRKLHALGVRLYSTGGTQKYLEDLGLPVTPVEDLTSYPSILGGRVKTLHPKVFGGILSRRNESSDVAQLAEYEIPEIDLVLVDLYPFEKTVASGASEQDIIEKIDIGGISLIRAAAKNFRDVLIIPSVQDYEFLEKLLENGQGFTLLEERRRMAARAFDVSSHYDSAIYRYFSGDAMLSYKESAGPAHVLRYGENPHQAGVFYGNLEGVFEKLNGKEISYNNLLDIDAAMSLIAEFEEPTIAVLKHNNACGIASRDTLADAWKDALAGDPVSAFGGIIVCNRPVDVATAEEMHKLFFEVLIAPDFTPEVLTLLTQKKNRIILKSKTFDVPSKLSRTILNGLLVQDRDAKAESKEDLKTVTKRQPTAQEISDLLFAVRIVKHTKSNAIVLVKNKQLLASGVGQTSRVDALDQAVKKAGHFGFDLKGSVMASDAFFPFPDCVEIADRAGIRTVIQPGGSVKDQDSVDYCDAHDMAMVMTGFRHFRH